MLTPAFSELQAPSKFPELSMECKQSHFKIKMPQWENSDRTPTGPCVARRCVYCVARVRAASDRRFPHRQNHSWRANGRNWLPYGPVTFCLQRNFIGSFLITTADYQYTTLLYVFFLLFNHEWRYRRRKLSNYASGRWECTIVYIRSSYLEVIASIVYSLLSIYKGGLTNNGPVLS